MRRKTARESHCADCGIEFNIRPCKDKRLNEYYWPHNPRPRYCYDCRQKRKALNPPPEKFRFHTTCGSAKAEDLEEMYEAGREVTRKEFLRHVEGMKEMEKNLGYASHWRHGLIMAHDHWGGISYHLSTYRGVPCAYFVWSQIDHIFIRGGYDGLENS